MFDSKFLYMNIIERNFSHKKKFYSWNIHLPSDRMNAACGNGNPDHASANLVLIRRCLFSIVKMSKPARIE